MNDMTKTIGVVTAIHQCFSYLRDDQPKPPRYWYAPWRRRIAAPLYCERNYMVAHRQQPYFETLIVPHDACDRAKRWAKTGIDNLLTSLDVTSRPAIITTGRLVVIFETETTPDGVVYGFLVQERIDVRK